MARHSSELVSPPRWFLLSSHRPRWLSLQIEFKSYRNSIHGAEQIRRGTFFGTCEGRFVGSINTSRIRVRCGQALSKRQRCWTEDDPRSFSLTRIVNKTCHAAPRELRSATDATLTSAGRLESRATSLVVASTSSSDPEVSRSPSPPWTGTMEGSGLPFSRPCSRSFERIITVGGPCCDLRVVESPLGPRRSRRLFPFRDALPRRLFPLRRQPTETRVLKTVDRRDSAQKSRLPV